MSLSLQSRWSEAHKSLIRRHEMERCHMMAHVEQLHSQTIRLSSNNDAMGRLIKFSALSQNGHLSYDALTQVVRRNDPIRYLHLQHHYERHVEFLVAHKLPPLLPRRVASLQSTEVPNCFTFLSVVGACCLANATFSSSASEKKTFVKTA